MLHEALLALSGHPSPIFDSSADGVPLLTPSEKSLLHRLDHLASLHQDIRRHCHTVLRFHPSAICKTTVHGILHVHLRDFSNLILQVEQQTLSKDAVRVGAHNIVPLASILNDFEPWLRRLEWLLELVIFILPNEDASSVPTSQGCHGSQLLVKVKEASHTGYPDLRQIALHLLDLGERAWLRQLMRWFLQPEDLYTTTHDLFLVSENDSDDGSSTRTVVAAEKLPGFVHSETALSVLFVGRTLKYLKAGSRPDGSSNSSQLELSPKELAKQFAPIAKLGSPLSVTSFSSGISSIRASLTQRIVGGLLPIRQIVRTVDLLRQFFLFGRSAFADALIVEADKLLIARKARIKNTPLALGGSLAGIMMKEGEVNTALSKAFISLLPYLGKDDTIDSDLDWARENLRMIIVTDPPSRREKELIDTRHVQRFYDFLFSTPARLQLSLEAPLDLFLSSSDLDLYSNIHSYILSIQRARSHLGDLWRETAARRTHPAPAGPPRSNKSGTMKLLREQRQKCNERTKAMRSTWSTASSTIYVLSELGNYLVSEVIGESWESFAEWIGIEQGKRLHVSGSSSTGKAENRELPQDPEMLSEAHRLYLRSMTKSLLMTEEKYLHILHSLLKHVGHFIAVNMRLLHVQRNLDLQAEGVVYGGVHNFEEEEKEVYEEILGAGFAVQSDLKLLVSELQRIDSDRVQRGPSDDSVQIASTGFEPWKGYGIDRLLLRLDVTHQGHRTIMP